MTAKKVKQWRGIKIGDKVSMTPDSGFDTNKTSYHVVKSITAFKNTPDEQCRLCLPREDAIFEFTDGGTGDIHDRIRKVEKFPQKVVAF